MVLSGQGRPGALGTPWGKSEVLHPNVIGNDAGAGLAVREVAVRVLFGQ